MNYNKLMRQLNLIDYSLHVILDRLLINNHLQIDLIAMALNSRLDFKICSMDNLEEFK